MLRVEWEKLKGGWQQFPNISAVWVFGSAKEGIIRDGGDLDVGVLFEIKPSLDDLAELSAVLQEKLQIEDIDLISLNEASPILRFEALCGRCLYSSDDAFRSEFASLSSREYEDEMAMIEKYISYFSGKESGNEI